MLLGGVNIRSAKMQALRRLSLRRFMHGHAPDHGHGHSQVDPPRFLGLHKGRKNEGYELPTYVFLASFVGVIILTALSPETRATEWAKDEGEERIRRREAGEEVEFGHNYFAERQKAELLASRKRS